MSIGWTRFTEDPRNPSRRSLRASDADRAVAAEALGDAYADGRLTREEYDERSAVVSSAKTLGELHTQLADLAADTGPGAVVATASPAAVAQAQASYRHARAAAMTRFAWVVGICWVIWGVSFVQHHALAGLWPIWVTIGMGWSVVGLITNKQAYLERTTQKIERRNRQTPH